MLDLFADPTADQFRSLARSSPWRWSTLEYERSVFGGERRERGSLRRPDKLRVESSDGAVSIIEASLDSGGSTVVAVGFIGCDDLDPAELAAMTAEASKPKPRIWPTEAAPVYDEDGLVLARPHEAFPFAIQYDPPFHRDYHWVATLDPVELADGRDGAAEPPVELHDLRAVLHHGRPAWEALATPTARYSPRCGCCPLLAGDDDERNSRWIPSGPSLVRLDVQTGVCVFVLRPDDGSGLEARTDLDLRVIAVDEAMDDELFREPE
ncbi:MAG: hypothetical protein ACRC20_00605 [Segniliparus sp.]|uniref:hypothetical protein n=1 Tax=Segniliparus sp. TaxID=2804064 RepID=UPI003F4164F5